MVLFSLSTYLLELLYFLGGLIKQSLDIVDCISYLNAEVNIKTLGWDCDLLVSHLLLNVSLVNDFKIF